MIYKLPQRLFDSVRENISLEKRQDEEFMTFIFQKRHFCLLLLSRASQTVYVHACCLCVFTCCVKLHMAKLSL